MRSGFAALAFGSSTGGPEALGEILRHLRQLPQPIFITQHLSPSVTEILAQQLSHRSGVPCSEAIEGEIIRSGHAYLAPRDRHLTLRRFGADLRVTLADTTMPHDFCPAIDPMLCSLAEVYGDGLCAVILSGMGADGVAGAASVKAAGGMVLAQDLPSSIAKGMPAAVIKAGLADLILPLPALGPRLRAVMTQPERVAA